MYVVTNTFAKRKSNIPYHLKRMKKVQLGILSILPGKKVSLTDEIYERFRNVLAEYERFGMVSVSRVGGESKAEPKVEAKPEKKPVEKPAEEPKTAEVKPEEPKTEEKPLENRPVEEKPVEKPKRGRGRRKKADKE